MLGVAHVYEIADYQSAEVAKSELAGDLGRRFYVALVGGSFGVFLLSARL